MKQVKTLSNSFLLIDTDRSGNVTSKLGFKKGGLSYKIINNNIKFYLTEDYFYKNAVWSADIPLEVDGVVYDINTLPNALKKIFILDKEEGEITVDQVLDETSLNPIGNQAVAKAVSEHTRQILDRYTKAETNTLLQSYYTKMETNALFSKYTNVDGDTITLNNENITI